MKLKNFKGIFLLTGFLADFYRFNKFFFANRTHRVIVHTTNTRLIQLNKLNFTQFFSEIFSFYFFSLTSDKSFLISCLNKYGIDGNSYADMH